MVHKIRLFILLILCVLLCFSGFSHKGHIETNILKTLLPKNTVNSEDMVLVANKSASIIKVVFESDNPSELEKLKQNFINQTDKDYFEVNKFDTSLLINGYLSQPANFLTENTRKLLFDNKYNEVYDKSIKDLYDPAKIQLTTLDKDPYLLCDDFIASIEKKSNSTDYLNNKYYDFMRLKIKDKEALSPTLSNKKIKELIQIQKTLSSQSSKIYLAGTPIHSYYTSMRSIVDINIISILSTLLIVFLTYLYFKNLKLLLPTAIGIVFGMLSGYVSTRLWFEDFQIITMVFSATLIGIGIDYSYHYFFLEKIDKQFIKNLSLSLITTLMPFVLLYFTGIELLKQIAVYTIFGLFGIYFIVVFIYPCFENFKPVRVYRPSFCLYGICLIVFIILSLFAINRLHFNDDLSALYTPSTSLFKAEKLYNEISAQSTDYQIITLKANNVSELIKQEEKTVQNLNQKNIEYISLSKLFPSEERQKENYNLVKKLYDNNLDKFSNILSAKQIKELKNQKFTPVKFDNLYLKDFMLNSNTSMIIVFDNQKLNIANKDANIVNIQSDIKNYMRHYGRKLIILFPVVMILIYILFTFLYGFKKALKIILPSVVGIIVSILMTSLIFGELNLFSIISVFLVLGFTIDYSIFRLSKEENIESSIFVSCLTTSFSFFLLALCGFKMLSSIATVLFFGILTSYIAGYLILGNHGKIKL